MNIFKNFIILFQFLLPTEQDESIAITKSIGRWRTDAVLKKIVLPNNFTFNRFLKATRGTETS